MAVAPNDKLLATGSQDRTAKLWALPHCQLLGIFSGHRRGLWCVQFSPMDQVLATASADGTIKLWALQDFSCLKVSCPAPRPSPSPCRPSPPPGVVSSSSTILQTFEGHDASVLKVVFVSRGTQLLSRWVAEGGGRDELQDRPGTQPLPFPNPAARMVS